MNLTKSKIKDQDGLLKHFNNRNDVAFGEVYNNFFTNFHLYASTLFTDTDIEATDAVQDVFLYIWQNARIKFDTFHHLKAFVIISLKNRYKTLKKHQTHKDKYAELNSGNFTDEVEVFGNSMYSYLEEVYNVLPKDGAQVIRLYIDGWSYEEIAIKLGKSTKRLYNIKSEAISILRKKMTKEELFIIKLFIGI